MKSFITQSKFELWLLATIGCMQTEKRRENKELFYLPMLSTVKIM